MHKRTLRVKGISGDGNTKLQITGQFGEKTSEGTCVSVALGRALCLIKRGDVEEVKKTLCFDDSNILKNSLSFLDHCVRDGMIFFVWRNLEGYCFVYLIPSPSRDFEMDDFLENLLDLAMAPDIRFWSGKNYDQDYEVTRVNKNALEVLGQHQQHNTHVHVGYVGVGVNLREAISGISSIITR